MDIRFLSTLMAFCHCSTHACRMMTRRSTTSRMSLCGVRTWPTPTSGEWRIRVEANTRTGSSTSWCSAVEACLRDCRRTLRLQSLPCNLPEITMCKSLYAPRRHLRKRYVRTYEPQSPQAIREKKRQQFQKAGRGRSGRQSIHDPPPPIPPRDGRDSDSSHIGIRRERAQHSQNLPDGIRRNLKKTGVCASFQDCVPTSRHMA